NPLRRRVALPMWAVLLTVGAVLPVASGIAAVTTASAVPATLVGPWNRNVKASPNGALPGVWTMVMNQSGVANFYTAGGYKPGCIAKHTCVYLLSANLSVAGGRLTVSPFTGAFASCSMKATYSWKVAGKSLTIKVISDTDPSCGAPRKALLAGVWKRTQT